MARGHPAVLRVSRELRVRDRIVPRAEPQHERLFDPLVDDLVHGGELSRARFAVHWSDTAALAELAAAKRFALPDPLAREMRVWHQARGAHPESLANLQ